MLQIYAPLPQYMIETLEDGTVYVYETATQQRLGYVFECPYTRFSSKGFYTCNHWGSLIKPTPVRSLRAAIKRYNHTLTL